MIAGLVCMTTPAEAQEGPRRISLLNSLHVEVGAVENPGAVEFSGIVGAVLLPGGQVVIADGGSHVIHWLDAAGGLVRSLGREGEGPGEFRGLHWLGECPGGELIALDPINGRATFLAAATGAVVRTRRTPPVLGFSRPLRCESEQSLIALMDRPRERGAPGRVTTSPAVVAAVDLSSGAVDTMLTLSGTEFYFGSRTLGYSFLPLGVRAIAAAGGGHLYAGRNDRDVLLRIDLRSGGRSRTRHELPRVRVTEALWDAELNDLVDSQPLARSRELLRNVLAEALPPAEGPAFVAMYADRGGRLWLRQPDTAAISEWRVLEADGRHAFTIILPRGVEPLDLRDDRLAAVARDSLGVPSLRLYALPAALRAPRAPRP